MRYKIRRSILYLPIVLIELYLLVTFLLCLYGPWDFKLHNVYYTTLLVLLYQVALFLGYNHSLKNYKPKMINVCLNYNPMKLLIVFSSINLILLIMNMFRNLNISDVSVEGLITRIIFGILQPGLAYNSKFDSNISGSFGGDALTYANVMFEPISYVIIPLNMIFFEKMKYFGKIIAIFNISFSVLGYIASGTNKGVFDVIIFAMVIYSLKKLKKMNEYSKQVKIKKIIIIMMSLVCVGMVLFNYALSDRGTGSSWNNSSYTIGGQVYLDSHSFWVENLPEGLARFIAMLTMYTSQGYYGFSLTTDLDWIPMYGLGSNKFVLDKLYKNDIDLIKDTYQYRIEKEYGWDRDVQWPTLYTYLASDLGHYGIILFMFIIGYLFAALYMECILLDNNISKLIFSLLSILLVFLPANNQLSQGIGSMVSFLCLLIFWIFYRGRKINVKL